MRLIDKIALNRAIRTILDFILDVIKLFVNNTQDKDDNTIKPKPRRILPWRRDE